MKWEQNVYYPDKHCAEISHISFLISSQMSDECHNNSYNVYLLATYVLYNIVLCMMDMFYACCSCYVFMCHTGSHAYVICESVRACVTERVCPHV